MSERVTIAKTRRVPDKVGDTPADQARNLLAARAVNVQPTARAERARGDVFSTGNAKAREALGEDYGRDYFSSGESYTPPLSPGESFWDTLNSIPSTAMGAAESLAGGVGDIADMRYDLARWLNRKLSAEGGGNRSVNRGIDTAESYDPLSTIPNTEDVQRTTDPLIEAAGAEDVLRYQPQSPWGQGLYTAGQFVDPPLGAASKAARVLKNVMKGAR